jgi:hypothetical protein
MHLYLYLYAYLYMYMMKSYIACLSRHGAMHIHIYIYKYKYLPNSIYSNLNGDNDEI